MRISEKITDHPASVGQTYFEHFKFAVKVSTSLLKAFSACLIHAIYPPVHKNTASATIAELHNRIEQRKASELIDISHDSELIKK
jgi:hypothetical protein|tara:strand:- start:75 stop:329 length:255 start_codon:yes stop_codon:yes gene_type:complete